MTSKTDSVLPCNMMLTGVFGGLTMVLLVAILVVTLCLCIHHRKRVAGMKIQSKLIVK